MQYMFIISDTIDSTEHEDLTYFKGHICFSNLFMSIRLMKKQCQVPITSLSLHGAIYTICNISRFYFHFLLLNQQSIIAHLQIIDRIKKKINN